MAPGKKLKRVITPHKGGRSAILPSSRMHPEVLEGLKSVCEALGISVADWIDLHARADHVRLQAAQNNEEPLAAVHVLNLGGGRAIREYAEQLTNKNPEP